MVKTPCLDHLNEDAVENQLIWETLEVSTTARVPSSRASLSLLHLGCNRSCMLWTHLHRQQFSLENRCAANAFSAYTPCGHAWLGRPSGGFGFHFHGRSPRYGRKPVFFFSEAGSGRFTMFDRESFAEGSLMTTAFVLEERRGTKEGSWGVG